jgi:protein-S-isoprenylcysteine O-methyltransferase Ste14
MSSILHTIVTILWIAWLVIWLVASINIKRTRVLDTTISRLVIFIIGGVAFVLLFILDVQLGWLDHRFMPRSFALEVPGAILTALGLAFSLWARFFLGRNWSSSVRIGRDHELIRSGPYARIRHPIYSGLLFAALGTALVVGRWRGLAAVILFSIGFAYKAKREERLLAQEFGLAFEEHRRRTGFFLPRFP